MMKINDRTPFHLISTIFLFVTMVLSFVSTFQTKTNLNDFFPNPYEKRGIVYHDSSWVDKTCWYYSQITHHTILLLFAYFSMALFNKRSEVYFKMVAPLAMTISVLYFYFLFPKQSLSVHQLPFSNFFSHFMIIFLVLGEFLYISSYDFKETSYCFIFILTSLVAVYINYLLRGVWSYNLLKLDRYSGWKLVSMSVLVMYFFSFLFSITKTKMNKAKFITTRYLLRSTPFISGIINIIFFLCFEKYNTCKSDIINEKYGDKIVKTIDHILPVWSRIIFLKKLLIESS